MLQKKYPNMFDETIKIFKQTKTKIAIQKDGELSEISKSIIQDMFGVDVDRQDDELISVSSDGIYGFVFTRNKSICKLLLSGAVDAAVIGIDRLIEDYALDRVQIVKEYKELGLWKIVLATPTDSKINARNQIKTVATQYPVITQNYFDKLGIANVSIVESQGGTEIYPYLKIDGRGIDAVVDLTVTGESLKRNNLVRWKNSLADIYPVYVERKPK